MFRKASTIVLVALTGACATSSPSHTPQVTFIDFRVMGADGFQGVLAISEDRLSRDELSRFEQDIRGFVFLRGSPPRDLNACFYIDKHRYGITRVPKGNDGSYVLQLEHYPDAGVSYQFMIRSDGTVRGSGGFWGGVGSDGSRNVQNELVGSYRLVANINECTSRFPQDGT